MRLLSRVVTAGAVSVVLRGEQGRWCRKGEAMSLRSMRKGGWRLRHAPVANAEADCVSRAVPVEVQDHHAVKIIMVRVTERLLVAQRMSTGPGGDCETPFFPDDSDVGATESRRISLFCALSEVGRPRCRS